MSGSRLPWLPRGMARLALFALGCIPFLVPVHLRPITSFYGEWVAAAIALTQFAVALLLRRPKQTLPLPWMLLLPAVFLAVIALQLVMHRIYFPQQALIHACYLLLAAVSMISGRAMLEEFGASSAARTLASGMAIGALLQVAVIALQLQRITVAGWTTPLERDAAAYGNLGQPNLLADYLWLGVASLVYLAGTKTIARIPAAIAVLAILMAAPLTGSRSALLYPLALAGVSAMAWVRSKGTPAAAKMARSFAYLTPVALILAFLMGSLAPQWLGTSASSATRALHDANTSASQSIRLALLRTGVNATLANPWLGGGVGAVPLQSLEYAPDDGDSVRFGVAEHFHNLPVNWMAEFGIPAALFGLALCAFFVSRTWCREFSAEAFWLFAILSVVGVHSLLEYPLWHSFFLIPCALLAGAASPSNAVFRLSRSLVAAFAVAVLLGFNLLYQLQSDHAGLARVSHLVPTGPQAQIIWRRHMDDLLAIHRTSLFSPYVSGMLVVAFDINRQQLADKSKLCESAIHFSPAPEVLLKCAMNSAIAGDMRNAKLRLGQGARAFAAEVPHWRETISTARDSYPELAPLLVLLDTNTPTQAK